MLTAVASGFALALVAPVLSRALRARAAWLLALVPAAVFAWLIGLAPSVAAGATRREAWPWIAPLGTQAAFLLDGLSLLFGLLVSGIGALVFAYSGAYLAGDARAPRFYAILSVFMASMLGLVLADDLLLLFVFWELTSVTSYLLVGYDHERPGARAAALQALLVTAGGGHGGPVAGERLPPLRDDGEGRGVPARAPLGRARHDGRLARHRGARGRGHDGHRRRDGPAPARPQADPGLHDGERPRHDHAPHRARDDGSREGRGGLPDGARAVQGRAVPRGRRR
jgi:hypothetical protein